MKKTFSLLLALTLIFSCMVLPTFAYADEAVLRVEVFDRSIAGLNVEDCLQLNYVKDNFTPKTGIDVQFVSVSRWDEGEILTTQLAGGTAPDICITYQGALVNQYIDMGGVYDLTGIIDEYGPNIKAFLGEALLGYGQFDKDGDGVKEQYIIPARRISVANVGTFIRQDWLDTLGMEAPTNYEEFEAYLYAAKEQNLGGVTTIPYAVNLYASNPMFGLRRLTDCFVDTTKLTEEDWVAYSSNPELLPGAKEGLRLLNKWYNDGIVYENFGVDGQGDLLTTYKTQGYCGFFQDQPDSAWRSDKSYQQELEKNVEGGKWVAVNFGQNIYTGEYLHDIYDAAGLSIFVPGWVSESTAIAAVKYLDWMCEYENMFFLQNGVEGVNYTALNEDGIPTGVKTVDQVPDEYKLHAGDICFISNGLFYGSDEANAAAVSLSYPGYEEDVKLSYVYAMQDSWTQISFTEALEASTDYLATVHSKQGELVTQCITCSPEKFDETYEKYAQAVLDAGAEEIIEAYRDAYQRGEWRGSVPASIGTALN